MKRSIFEEARIIATQEKLDYNEVLNQLTRMSLLEPFRAAGKDYSHPEVQDMAIRKVKAK